MRKLLRVASWIIVVGGLALAAVAALAGPFLLHMSSAATLGAALKIALAALLSGGVLYLMTSMDERLESLQREREG